MKAWILIGFYLWKDIWSRWLETPGAVLARLLVACLLGSLLFLAQAGFTLIGRSLEHRVSRMGAQTLFVSELVTPEAMQGRAPLDRLLSPLADRADVLAFKQIAARATDTFGHDYQVMLHTPETFAQLAPLFAADADVVARVFNDRLPAGLRIPVTVEDTTYLAATVGPPAWLRRLPVSANLILLPDDALRDRQQFGYQELALVIGRDDDPGAIRPLGRALREVLRLENRAQAQIRSPEVLLDELDALRSSQRRWQAGAGFAGGLAVALVFGSIAILEYRQNKYIVALIRSFGVPAFMLFGRYLTESLLMVTAAIALAWVGVTMSHAWLFGRLGFEAGLLERSVVDPYTLGSLGVSILWLYAGAVLGALPLARAVRQPVGRILQ